jgi:hypothetical protein
MLPHRPVAPTYREWTGARASISAVWCKPRSLMGFQERGRETPRCVRPMAQRQGGPGCLVARNKDFIRAIDGPMDAVAEKKLEFTRNPGYSLNPHHTIDDGLTHGRGAAAVLCPFPRLVVRAPCVAHTG